MKRKNELLYSHEQLVRMSEEEVMKLGLLCPKFAYFSCETSGSPSAWTHYGEQEMRPNGAEIVKAAQEIREIYDEICAYNDDYNKWGTDLRRAMDAYIRVVF